MNEIEPDAPRDARGAGDGTAPAIASVAEAFALAVEQLEVLARVRAEHDALEQRVLASVYDASLAMFASEVPGDGAERLEHAIRSAAMEVAAATRSSPRTAASRITEAHQLVGVFPTVVAAMAAGEITARHARVLREQGARLDTDEQRDEFCRRLLPVARSQAHTRLESRAKAVVEELLGQSAAERAAAARSMRRVAVQHGDDGMSELYACIPTFQAVAIMDRLTHSATAITQAAAASGEPEVRRYDQLRADVFADLLLTADPTIDSHEPASGIRASVSVTVPVLSMLGLDHAPASIDGSPIPFDDAMLFAGEATSWVRVLTDPASGAPLAVDTRTPSRTLRQFVRARDQHCRVPGCRRPAARCDLDHATPWADGGPTSAENLHAVCRGHHTTRHWARWRAHHNPDTGALDWIAPSGRRYGDEPTPAGPVFTPTDVQRLRQGAGAKRPRSDPEEPPPF